SDRVVLSPEHSPTFVADRVGDAFSRGTRLPPARIALRVQYYAAEYCALRSPPSHFRRRTWKVRLSSTAALTLLSWILPATKQYLAPNGYVVSLQNCVNEETIAGIVGWGKTLGSIVSSITVELHAPGQVRRAAGKSGPHHTVFRVGEVHGRITDRAKEVC